MALTATERVRTVIGNKRLHIFRVVFDSSYPTGGESFSPGVVGLNGVEAMIPAPSGIEFAVYDYTNKKLQLFTADGTEATNASNQSTIGATCVVIGI
jgi:hypothetical protein